MEFYRWAPVWAFHLIVILANGDVLTVLPGLEHMRLNNMTAKVLGMKWVESVGWAICCFELRGMSRFDITSISIIGVCRIVSRKGIFLIFVRIEFGPGK